MMTVKNFEELFAFIAAADVPADCELSYETSLALEADYTRQKYQEETNAHTNVDIDKIYTTIKEKGTISCYELSHMYNMAPSAMGTTVKTFIEQNKVVKYRNRSGFISYAVVEE